MIELGNDFDLVQKSLWSQCLSELRLQNLEGDLTVVFQVLGEIDEFGIPAEAENAEAAI